MFCLLKHIEREQFADAINSLQTAIDYKPDHIEAWNNIGLIYQNLGEQDDYKGKADGKQTPISYAPWVYMPQHVFSL